MRKNATKEENKLWYQFLKNYPIQFRRQYQIGNYIVDFYSYRVKLVIELDGSQHFGDEALLYDRNRTQYLEEQGLLVIRIPNNDINHNFRAVCDYIDRIAQIRCG